VRPLFVKQGLKTLWLTEIQKAWTRLVRQMSSILEYEGPFP
jgi:hypothetical protein